MAAYADLRQAPTTSRFLGEIKDVTSVFINQETADGMAQALMGGAAQFGAQAVVSLEGHLAAIPAAHIGKAGAAARGEAAMGRGAVASIVAALKEVDREASIRFGNRFQGQPVLAKAELRFNKIVPGIAAYRSNMPR